MSSVSFIGLTPKIYKIYDFENWNLMTKNEDVKNFSDKGISWNKT